MRSSQEFTAFYRGALPEVYAYVLHRCGSVPVAEDVTQEAFLAAVRAATERPELVVNVAWVIGVARHKLLDHFRRQRRWMRDRETGGRGAVRSATDDVETWVLEPTRTHVQAALEGLPGPHRLVLFLRYADMMTVPEIAAALGRSVDATESLLVRARDGFKRRYAEVHDV